MDPITQYIIPAVIGAVGGAIGGLITAGAMLLNGNRQRQQEQTLEQQRTAHGTQGIRREIEARLREFGGHVAHYRALGAGELGAMQSTFDRLNALMGSEKGGPAALPSDERAREVYSMLDTARLNLRTLDRMIENDRQLEGQLSGSDLQDWWELCGIRYSQIVKRTADALMKIFDNTNDVDAKQMLEHANTEFDTRQSAYAARDDAKRQSLLRAVLAARENAEWPSDSEDA